MLKPQKVQSALEKSCSREHCPQIIRCAMIPNTAAGQPEASWQIGHGNPLGCATFS